MMSEDKQAGAAEETTLIYDGECPVCVAYSGSVDTDAATGGELRRINARSDHELVRQATEQGFDLDEGMIVSHQGKLYHGADALHIMATLAPNHGVRNRLNKVLFGSQRVSRAAYPFLRAGRNTLLKLLGKDKIRNLGSGGR